MNRYDESYSAYFAAPDADYPVGSAIDSTSEDNLDGTPYLAAFFNDVIGFMQAVFFGVFGTDAQVSNTPETARKSDVWNAIQKFVGDSDKAVKDALDADIADINAKIPAQASAQNQLADKDFVNSSIATNTAYFIDVFDSVEDLNAYSGVLTNNDYAYVKTVDSAGNVLYDRYKYDAREKKWKFEYSLNNTGFTAAQFAAINSGATAAKISQIKQMTGAAASAAGASGFVPAPAAGDQNKFLSGDGTWKKLTNPAIDSAWPVGVVYTQYPQQAAPGELFPGTTWQIISYSGAFFRAEGGNAAAFIEKRGILSKQNESAPNIIGTIAGRKLFYGPETESTGALYWTGKTLSRVATGESDPAGELGFDASRSNPCYGRRKEIAPSNYTIRVWKRIS